VSSSFKKTKVDITAKVKYSLIPYRDDMPRWNRDEWECTADIEFSDGGHISCSRTAKTQGQATQRAKGIVAIEVKRYRKRHGVVLTPVDTVTWNEEA